MPSLLIFDYTDNTVHSKQTCGCDEGKPVVDTKGLESKLPLHKTEKNSEIVAT
jgi:hypothetical protein